MDIPRFDANTTVNDFRQGFQHIVVKFGPRSRPAKDGIRFAQQQSDPDYYRIAMEKVHSQEQYHRMVFGSPRWERVMNFVNMGSLREIGITLALVTVACVGIETGRSWLGNQPAANATDDEVERLVQRMGFYISEDAAKSKSTLQRPVDSHRDNQTITPDQLDEILATKIQAAVDESLVRANFEQAITEQFDRRIDQLQQSLADRIVESLRRSTAPAPIEPLTSVPKNPEPSTGDAIPSSDVTAIAR